MIRNEYRFTRPLTVAETDLLMQLIGWRREARLVTDPSEAVVGCVAHPDDVAAFTAEVRKTEKTRRREPSAAVS